MLGKKNVKLRGDLLSLLPAASSLSLLSNIDWVGAVEAVAE